MITLETAIADAKNLVEGFFKNGHKAVFLCVGNGKLYVGRFPATSSTEEKVHNVEITSVDEVEPAFESFKKFWKGTNG